MHWAIRKKPKTPSFSSSPTLKDSTDDQNQLTANENTNTNVCSEDENQQEKQQSPSSSRSTIANPKTSTSLNSSYFSVSPTKTGNQESSKELKWKGYMLSGSSSSPVLFATGRRPRKNSGGSSSMLPQSFEAFRPSFIKRSPKLSQECSSPSELHSNRPFYSSPSSFEPRYSPFHSHSSSSSPNMIPSLNERRNSPLSPRYHRRFHPHNQTPFSRSQQHSFEPAPSSPPLPVPSASSSFSSHHEFPNNTNSSKAMPRRSSMGSVHRSSRWPDSQAFEGHKNAARRFSDPRGSKVRKDTSWYHPPMQPNPPFYINTEDEYPESKTNVNRNDSIEETLPFNKTSKSMNSATTENTVDLQNTSTPMLPPICEMHKEWGPPFSSVNQSSLTPFSYSSCSSVSQFPPKEQQQQHQELYPRQYQQYPHEIEHQNENQKQRKEKETTDRDLKENETHTPNGRNHEPRKSSIYGLLN